MTITVNGFETEPGCYVDGHWGQYGGVHLLERAEEFDVTHEGVFCSKLAEIYAAWPRHSDGELAGSYGADTDEITGPWAAIITCGASTGQTVMELSEEVLDLLNEHTVGGRWEWWEGECFLRETNGDGFEMCPECRKAVPDDWGEHGDAEACTC